MRHHHYAVPRPPHGTLTDLEAALALELAGDVNGRGLAEDVNGRGRARGEGSAGSGDSEPGEEDTSGAGGDVPAAPGDPAGPAPADVEAGHQWAPVLSQAQVDDLYRLLGALDVVAAKAGVR